MARGDIKEIDLIPTSARDVEGRYSTGIATTRNLVIVWFAVHRLLGCSVVVEISGITVNSG